MRRAIHLMSSFRAVLALAAAVAGLNLNPAARRVLRRFGVEPGGSRHEDAA